MTFNLKTQSHKIEYIRLREQFCEFWKRSPTFLGSTFAIDSMIHLLKQKGVNQRAILAKIAKDTMPNEWRSIGEYTGQGE